MTEGFPQTTGLGQSNFYSVKEAAEVLKWKTPKVLRAIKKGQLPAEKVGGWNIIISKAAVHELANTLELEKKNENDPDGTI